MRFRFGLTVLLPFLALGLQWLLWPWLSPLAWFLFFPAVFFSASLGGFKGGLTSTGLSAVIVWYFFIPTQYSFRLSAPSDILSVGMFLLVGCLISEIRGRLDHLQVDLQLRETRFRQIVDNMSSGVAVYEAVNDGRDFIFKDFNRAAERIEQIPKQDVIGKKVTRVFPGVTDFGLIDVFRRVRRTGIAENHPISFYEDERIAGWRENHISKLPSGEIVAICDDVTTRKQAEERLKISEAELRRHRDRLEELVKERTAELEALDFLFAEGSHSGRILNQTPRLVLLDLKLPKVDGLDVLRRVKSDEKTRAIPVVVLTSSREEKDMIESYRLGVNSYIQKPVDFDKFLDCVQELGFYWLLINQMP